MQKIRALHLYLGCVFAPMLLFFGISGLWQMLGFHDPFLRLLSTIHTSHQMKTGGSLTSYALKTFVLLMAVSFILTIVLGVIMALKHGKSRRYVWGCLVFGIVFPLVLILVKAWA